MSYAVCEAAAQTLIQGLDAFADADVTRSDWTVLDRGSPPYVVLWRGAWEREEFYSGGGYMVFWMINVDVFERYLDDGSSYTNLEATAQGIEDELGKYPTLNSASGVVRAILIGGSEPTQVFDRAGGGPHFLLQTLRLRVHEVEQVTGGEFA